jgi:uncharacterized protein
MQEIDTQELVDKTIDFVKASFVNADSSHDYWHTHRVWVMSKRIAEKEGGDLFVIQMGALLHDVWDYKRYNGDEAICKNKCLEYLKSIGLDDLCSEEISNLVSLVSFKGMKNKIDGKSKELMIVQDADRLDAIGAIGLARAFAYGGHINRELYNPEVMPNPNMTKEQYIFEKNHTINHFYEKLLLLKDLMNTNEGKRIAQKRHKILEDFLENFYKEWDGLD